MSTDGTNSRDQDVRVRSELADAARRREAAAAQKLIDEFCAEAEKRGVAPVPIKARLMDGRIVKTNMTGWYIRQNRSIAVGTDGGYYQLTIIGGWRERLFGATIEPSPPPLVVGRGGRDGETGDLADFLDRVLSGEVEQS
ncbi:MAG: hypothetical protein CR980_00160 [Propionibacteriales bacterium]|nr:MAG: hypothetical protein CR980_00160 [Propionibacteriales bacterium]